MQISQNLSRIPWPGDDTDNRILIEAVFPGQSGSRRRRLEKRRTANLDFSNVELCVVIHSLVLPCFAHIGSSSLHTSVFHDKPIIR